MADLLTLACMFEVRKLPPGNELRDELGTELPTFERLRQYYSALADFLYLRRSAAHVLLRAAQSLPLGPEH